MNQKTLGSLITTLFVIVLLIVLLPVIFWVAIILLVIFAIFAIYVYFRSRKITKQFKKSTRKQDGFKYYYQQSGSEEKTTISPDVIDAEFTVKKKEVNE